MSGYRLRTGGRIHRLQTYDFKFDGIPYSGLACDTLASALIANGVNVVGRSFKYHRPRGIVTAGPEEPNALVDSASTIGKRPIHGPQRSSYLKGLRLPARIAGRP